MDSFATMLLAGTAVMFIFFWYMNNYGKKYQTGGGKLIGSERFEVANPMQKRPIYLDVNTHIWYFLKSTLRVTSKPKSIVIARFETNTEINTSLISDTLEVKFIKGEIEPVPLDNISSGLFNNAGAWAFSQVGIPSSDDMQKVDLEKAQRDLRMAREEVEQTKADSDAKVKNTFNMVSRLNRPPQQGTREE